MYFYTIRKKMKERISFIIASKIVKYLEINLTKEVKDLLLMY